MAESISYIKVGNQDHPIDAVTVNGLTLTSQEKSSWNEKQDALTFDSIPTENSDNPVKSGGVYEMITDNELVIATALNDLNDRLLDVENNSLTSESDPVFMSSPASSITVANISTWNAKQDALTFDSLPTENSDNLVKSGALYTVLTNTELVVATALNDLNQRVSSNQSSIYNLYEEIDRALTAVLTYKGTVGSNGDYTSLPSQHSVGDVYVVSIAGTYAGQACEVGDYIICKTSGTSASNAHWNVVNGENQVSNSAATLAAAGSNVTIATVDGTNITISTPASWTGVSKNGTLTGVTFNGVSASVSNGVANISAPVDIELIDVGIINSFPNASFPSGTFNTANQAIKDGKTVIIRTNDSENYNDWHTVAGGEDDSITLFNENYDELITLYSDDTVYSNSGYGFVRHNEFNFDSIPTQNSNNLVKSGDLYKVITDNEYVISTAINDLNDRLIDVEDYADTFTETDPVFTASPAASVTASNISSWNSKISGVTFNGVAASISNGVASISLTFDSIPTENSDNLVKSGDLYTVIVDNEEVTAAALNDLNDRMINVENGMVNFEEQDPIFSNSAAASISSANISSWNSKQDALTFDSVPTENSDNLVKSGDLYTVITQNEFVAAAALNDLNDRVEVLEENQYSFDSLPTENSENLVNSGALYSVIVSNERVVATALNDVNDRLMVLENNMSDAFESVYDEIYSVASTLQTSEEVTAAALNNLNGRVITLENSSGSGSGGITGVTFNGVSASISNGIAAISVSIPAAVTEATVSGWGFTKNAGTLTGVKFNGTSASVSNGVASITATIPTVNNSTITIQKNGTTVDSFTTNAASNKTINITVNELPAVTSSDVNGTSGNVLVASYDSTNGYHWEKTNQLTLYNNGSLSIPGSLGTTFINTGGISHNSFSNWSWILTSTGTGNTYKTLQDDLDAIRQLPAVTSSDSGKILVASYDSTIGYYWKSSNSLEFNSGLRFPGSVGTTKVTTGGINHEDYSDWSWITVGTGNNTRTLQSDIDAIRQLPAVTSSQNGQVLQVVNGQWTLVTPVSIYSGSSNPNNSQGTNGDLYLQTS